MRQRRDPVELEAGSIELGRMNGNIERPTVAMMPTAPIDEPPNASASRPVRMPTHASSGPAKPRTGAIIIHGYLP